MRRVCRSGAESLRFVPLVESQVTTETFFPPAAKGCGSSRSRASSAYAPKVMRPSAAAGVAEDGVGLQRARSEPVEGAARGRRDPGELRRIEAPSALVDAGSRGQRRRRREAECSRTRRAPAPVCRRQFPLRRSCRTPTALIGQSSGFAGSARRRTCTYSTSRASVQTPIMRSPITSWGVKLSGNRTAPR